jgi:hypothetical protein
VKLSERKWRKAGSIFFRLFFVICVLDCFFVLGLDLSVECVTKRHEKSLRVIKGPTTSLSVKSDDAINPKDKDQRKIYFRRKIFSVSFNPQQNVFSIIYRTT